MTKRELISDVLITIGFVIAVFGVWSISRPLSMVLIGIGILVAGVIAGAEKQPPSQEGKK